MISRNRFNASLIRSLTTLSNSASTTTPLPNVPKKTTNTISAAEIAHFTSLSSHWWDPIGEFSLLHRMNPARVQFVKDSLLKVEEFENGLESKSRWLEGKDVLDVGCGGGIFAEVSTHSLI